MRKGFWTLEDHCARLRGKGLKSRKMQALLSDTTPKAYEALDEQQEQPDRPVWHCEASTLV